MSKPVVITIAAILIVFALGIAGSRLLSRPQVDFSPQVQVAEHVMVSKTVAKYAPPPKLEISPPGNSNANASSGAQGTPPPAEIARTATMSLYVKDVDKAIGAVDDLARRRRGDVLSLNEQRTANQNEHPGAEMQVRIPDREFTSTMNALAQTGVVRTQTIAAEDLTSQIVDSTARLRNLRRTEGDILKIMDRSGSVGQVLEAENQLTQVREQIETTDAEVKNMVDRVRYSTVDLTLEAEAASVPAAPAGVAQLATAFAASTHALAQFTIGIVASLIWILTFAPYVVAVALIAFMIRRKLLRPV
jgi:hypothetical protein